MKTHSVFIVADSPTPRLRGDAPKTKSAAETIVKPAYSRVCQPPFSDYKARSKDYFRYAAAERILNPRVGAERILNPPAGCLDKQIVLLYKP
jgi:hypothetical protein